MTANGYIRILKDNRDLLSKQQYRTLKGQVLSGNAEAAMKGLETLKRRAKKCVSTNS